MTPRPRYPVLKMVWVVIAVVWLCYSCQTAVVPNPPPEFEPRWSTLERALGPQ